MYGLEWEYLSTIRCRTLSVAFELTVVHVHRIDCVRSWANARICDSLRRFCFAVSYSHPEEQSLACAVLFAWHRRLCGSGGLMGPSGVVLKAVG